VVGLARSGAAAARMLAGHGEVIGCDSGRPEPPEGVEAHLESDGLELLDRARTVVKSPGVPREAPVVQAALEGGIPVHGELELAWRLLPNRFLAVTGTTGKTTTVELLGAVHTAAGVSAVVAGNVGTPLASIVGEVDPRAVVVCEVSTFQLEDSTDFAPECALLLNIAEDHLDRHGSYEAYREAKLSIFSRQGPDDLAIAPADMDVARDVSFGGPGADLALDGGALLWRGEHLIGADEIRLRGAHNLENAMGASAAALATGIEPGAVRRALREFGGLPHRLEVLATVNGVLYVDDSKATNVAAATRGIESFDGGVHAILGGSLKGGGFTGLRSAVSARCRVCYLIGEAADRLAGDLEGTVPLVRSGDLETAVHEAAAAAQPGEVVLLSPACAAFDHYRDYVHRGEHFQALVPKE
jgi:UDP-N-acetylmuramoylalanine--D-glutamate ligase